MTLKLVVVDDPAIAKAVSQIKSEWKALSGAEIVITESTAAQVIAEKTLAADAIIYPSALIGSLVEGGLLAPIEKDALVSDELAWPDVFELLQSQEAVWGTDVYALPLGSPVFTVMYRADLFQKLDLKPPKTWVDYQAAAESVEKLAVEGQASNNGSLARGAIEPLGSGWAGRVFIARAATYAKHRDNYSALFRIDTMEPLIAGSQFVRALKELVAVRNIDKKNPPVPDPTGARRELLSGRAGMALTWASAANRDEDLELPDGAQIAFAELPGSDQIFNLSSGAFEKRSAEDSQSVPLLSIAGRVVSVSRSCEFPEAASQLICWLSGRQWSTKVSSSSPATTLFRNSHLKDAKQWVDANLSTTNAVEYGETVQRALTRQNALSALRIPGEAEYMAVLDEAVTAAVEGKASPEDALAAAAKKWTEITERLDKEKQRRAYQRSLGLNP